MKKIFPLILLFTASTFFACEKKDPIIEEEEEEMMEPIVWEKSMDIADFIEKYETGEITDDNIVLEGKVTTSDESNNNQRIYIQDNTAALSIGVSTADYYNRYPLGTELYILASDLEFTKDSRKLDLNDKSEDDHINVIDQGSIELGSIVSNLVDLSDEDLGQFVKIFEVQFAETVTGKTFGEVSEQLVLTKEGGSQILLSIAADSKFADEVIPYASGFLKGVITKIDGQYAISPNSIADLNFNGVRHSLFEKQTFEIDGFTLPYQVMYPKNYDPSSKYPLVIFLHGAGERGSNNTSQMSNGPATFTNEDARNNFPAIVIFPQCPSSDIWSRRTRDVVDGQAIFTFPVEETPSEPMNAVIKLTKEFMTGGSVNENQVYVMGLSMGGIGTLEFCYYEPSIPAAVISLVGGHDENLVSTYGNDIAIRLYAGANDNVVPAVYSQVVFDALSELPNSDVEFYLAEDRGHEWNYILNKEGEILPWLWSKSKE